MRIAKIYDYKNEAGELLYQVVRYAPKDFRQRRPDGNGGWIWNLENTRRVLYRLPELMTANPSDWVFIVEGEKDADRLYNEGLIATTCAMGAGKWNDNYSEYLNDRKNIAIIPDNDTAGRNHANQVVESLLRVGIRPKILELLGLPEKGDVSDWLDAGNNKKMLLLLAEKTLSSVEINKKYFKPLSCEELLEILDLTIKQDSENKLITFLCQLSAYTESSQFNISFNAPSSTGKSYIPTEISKLFPPEDVMEVGYCSPTAFFHDIARNTQKEQGTNRNIIDLERKILIFLDQPHNLLLQHLRPILSHDKKEILLKITDKNKTDGLKTKNTVLLGFPSVIFCTAGMNVDEQESTRFILLSPQTTQEKIRSAINERLKKETDSDTYKLWLKENTQRNLLKERILAIKKENIKEVKIAAASQIEQWFFERNKFLKPRHQRDIGKIISLVKSLTLLNLWYRDRYDDIVIASSEDISQACQIWEKIADSQEFGLSPYVYQLYKEIIVPVFNEKNNIENNQLFKGKNGLTRQEIIKGHFKIYGRNIADWTLRQEILPMLENSGLISQEADGSDRRKTLIYPRV